jgi:cytochrome d ubiquinol oxidase subunit I
VGLAGLSKETDTKREAIMFGLTALELARIQFGFRISAHIIFPAITIGLASYLAVLEGLWLWKKDPAYRDLYHFWSHIFAVNFAMGVVSGIVMAYQLGTNWSHYSAFAGTITGPLLSYEVLTAFFLEAGFLGVMLFGWSRVGPGLHFFATVMVAIGTVISAFWILASNSWMQTPQGFEIIDGRVVPVEWLKVIFNPSFPYTPSAGRRSLGRQPCWCWLGLCGARRASAAPRRLRGTPSASHLAVAYFRIVQF